VIRLVYVVHARDDVAPEEAIRARKYVQSHTIETPFNQALVESRGLAPIHQGITEVWWNSLEELEAAVASPEGAAAAARLVEDEAKFVDFSRSTIFLTEEHTIFER
jgi:hypothetical protein